MLLKVLSHEVDVVPNVSWCRPDVYRCHQNRAEKTEVSDLLNDVVPLCLPMCPYVCRCGPNVQNIGKFLSNPKKKIDHLPDMPDVQLFPNVVLMCLDFLPMFTDLTLETTSGRYIGDKIVLE